MTDRPIIVNTRDPATTAREFKAARYPNLLNFQQEWLTWDGSAYQTVENETVVARISEFLEAAKTKIVDEDGKTKLVPFKPMSGHIAEVYKALQNNCHIPKNTMSPPVWLEGAPKELAAINPRDLISFGNCLLDINTRRTFPQTPKFFTQTALNIEYDPDAPPPVHWLTFLDQITAKPTGEVGADGYPLTTPRPELVRLIREMLGYLISTDTSMQKVFFMFGAKRGGKGTILNVATALIGKNNTIFPSIKVISGRFGSASMIGKSLVQVTDMSTENKSELATTATLINGISGEDGQTIERKNIGDWHGRLGVRFLLAGNSLPNFSSATDAMATRLLIVPFEVSFLGREDRGLLPKLLRELPGILNWALDGLDDLRMRGDFDEPEASRLAKARLLNKSHPIHGFVTERCTIKPQAVTDKAVLFAEFIRYCEEVKARTSSRGDFTEKLEETFLSVQAAKRRQGAVGLPQVPCYRGIRFTDEMLPRVYKTKAPSPALAADLAELGLEPDVRSLLERDAAGYPIPRLVHDFD